MKTFTDEPDQGRGETLRVGVSERAVVADGETLVAYGVGSCVTVVLFDPRRSIGGMATVVLPSVDDGVGEATGRYADTAVPALLRALAERGASVAAVEAYVVGGSRIVEFEQLRTDVGRANVAAVRSVLAEFDLPIAGEDVGGEHGRTIEFDTDAGTVTVHAVGRDSVLL